MWLQPRHNRIIYIWLICFAFIHNSPYLGLSNWLLSAPHDFLKSGHFQGGLENLKQRGKNPTNTVGLYHVQPNLTIIIMEKLPEHAAQWGIHSLVIRLHVPQWECQCPLSHGGSDVPWSVSELLTSPCASPPASCPGTQNNNTSPFSLRQLPIPNCVRTEVFIPITIRIVLFFNPQGIT